MPRATDITTRTETGSAMFPTEVEFTSLFLKKETIYYKVHTD